MKNQACKASLKQLTEKPYEKIRPVKPKALPETDFSYGFGVLINTSLLLKTRREPALKCQLSSGLFVR